MTVLSKFTRNSILPYLIFIGVICLSCTTSRYFLANSKMEQGFRLQTYQYVTIYDSVSAGFDELLLSDFFKAAGYEIIGELEAPSKPSNSVLGVRYKLIPDLAVGHSRVTIALVDFTTDQTIFAARGSSYVGVPKFAPNNAKRRGWRRPDFDGGDGSSYQLALVAAFAEIDMALNGTNQESATKRVWEKVYGLEGWGR